MRELEIIELNSNKKLKLIIDLDDSITFDYLLEYLSYGYPQEHFCPCFFFINHEKTRYIEKKERVIDFIADRNNSNEKIKFYIGNPNTDKKCHCCDLLKNYYNKSKLEIIQQLSEVKEDYKKIFKDIEKEKTELKKVKHLLEMSIDDPELINKLQKLGIEDYLKPRENLEKVDPNNNQIIINKSVNKKNFVDFYDVIIDIKSIKDINKGWEIKMSDKGKQNYEKYNKKENLKIGVIGNSNKGKSFLLSKISKIDLPYGTSIRTEGLSIKYPDLEDYKDRKIILLDSAGLEAPILHESKPSNYINNEKQKFNHEEDNNINEKNNDKRDEFKEKSREKLITELFLQNFIINYSDILIIVVGILTYSEQKLINKIKKLQKEKKKGFDKKLFIIHNLITYTSIEQVEEYIKEYLLQSTTFTLEEGHNISTRVKSKTAKYYFSEKNSESKIYHLIYANEGSEAGKHYNKNTLDFLENSFQDINNLKSFDVIETLKSSFIDLSNEIFEKFDGNLTKKDFINNDNKYIKLINHNNLSLKKCFIDELGFSNLKSNGFDPKYNYYKKGNKIIIRIESPGNIGQIETSINEIEGYHKLIKIKGEKKNDKDPENKKDNIYNSREFGKYSLEIPIAYDDNYILKNEDPKIYNKNGLLFVEYQMEEKTKEKIFNVNNEEEV